MMPNYRRSQTPGDRYFFTAITYRRRPLLTDPESRRILREAIIDVRRECPFQIEAWVLYHFPVGFVLFRGQKRFHSSFPRKRVSSCSVADWIPAFAGMTKIY